MAASRKPPSADAGVLGPARRALGDLDLRGARVVVGLSGGIDSVVLLHALQRLGIRPAALHVHHGLSRDADAWQSFCRTLCRDLKVPFSSVKVKVRKKGAGLEAAAREARYGAFRKARPDVLVLAHQLDDQAETVLFNLLRGTGLSGASGMAADGRRDGMRVLRPLLQVPRSAIRAYAKAHRLKWVEDASNDNEALTRNFLRRQVGPLLESRFPRWRESLARAARHFAAQDLDAQRLLRDFLARKGLRAPSEAKLLEMLKQLGSPRAAISHDGMVLRRYKDKVVIEKTAAASPTFAPKTWKGERRLKLPGGELRFRRARGQGIDRAMLQGKDLQVRPRAGGERLRMDARRPRRTLKNLFQEANVPPWERQRMPLLFCGDNLVWAPVLGVDAAYRAAPGGAGLIPEWHASAS